MAEMCCDKKCKLPPVRNMLCSKTTDSAWPDCVVVKKIRFRWLECLVLKIVRFSMAAICCGQKAKTTYVRNGLRSKTSDLACLEYVVVQNDKIQHVLWSDSA
jgi:hypothetical protein